jgi:uncharacterized membrane protein YfcA
VETEILLFILALAAGLVDAIAGGGGLITLPALLWAGLGPLEALATNKAQGVFGTAAASANFLRQGLIDLRPAALAFSCAFVGAASGVLFIRHIGGDLPPWLIPALLIAFSLYFLISPRVSDLDARQRLSQSAFAFLVALPIGFYDGFFGPGTGSFLAMGYVALLGYNLSRATAHAKLLNFASNLAALLFFIPSGHVLWRYGLLMAAGQSLGAWLGSHLVIRHGTRLIRPALVTASLAISLKLLLDSAGGMTSRNSPQTTADFGQRGEPMVSERRVADLDAQPLAGRDLGA